MHAQSMVGSAEPAALYGDGLGASWIAIKFPMRPGLRAPVVASTSCGLGTPRIGAETTSGDRGTAWDFSAWNMAWRPQCRRV